MNKNLPIEVKESNIFGKIFTYVKNIFKKSNKQDLPNEETKILDNDKKKKPLFEFENITDNTSKEKNKKQILEEIIGIIEKRPDMLENLEIEKLEIIDMYYKNKVNECRIKLNKKNANK